MKKGLVLEGGAMRGMFTCGVLDVFMENGIEFDGAAGISAGATFGCNIKSRQIGRAFSYNRQYMSDKRYMSREGMLKTGDIFGKEFCKKLFDEICPFDKKTFAENPMEFYVGATDVETGRAVYHKCTDGGDLDFEWIWASSSMPIVANMTEIGGRKYLDGGIADSIPYRFMEKMGYEYNVVVLTQPAGYVKTRNSTLPLIRIKYREHPRLIDSVRTRHVRYNRTTEYIAGREAEGKALVIRPDESLGIGRLETSPGELERVYEIGRKKGREMLGQVRDFLARP